MATIQTIRPTGTVYYGSIAGGAPSASTISDNSDATNVAFFQEFLGETSYVYSELTSYSIGSTRVAAARGRARFRMPVSSSASPLIIEMSDGGSGIHNIQTTNVAGNGWQELATSWRTTDFLGTEWDQATVDGLWMETRATSSMSGSAAWEVSEHYVDLDVRTQPSVIITSPTAGQKVPSQTPTIFWSNNNQGDTISRHHVKIFTAATVGGGGFDPTTSPTVYDSSATPGSATSKTSTTSLTPGGSYYAYVRIATDFNGTDWWSNWGSVQFLISQVPVVSAVATNPATPITTTNQPNITGTYTDADGESSEWFNIKIFTEAVYSAGGFNPDTATPTWQGTISQTVASGANFSIQVGTPLSANVNYKAWVRASEVGAGQRWSAWASSAVAFVIQTAPGIITDPPAKPLITATADQNNQRVILDVLGRDNILTRNQASIDTGVIGWEADTNISGALTRNTTTFLQGGGSLRFVALGAGSTKVRTIGNQTDPVVPGLTYTALASMRAEGGTARTAQVLINWYTTAGAYISTTVGTSAAINNAGWTALSASAVAPGTAAYAQIILEVTNAGAGEAFFADNNSFAPGTSTTWHRGGLAAEIRSMTDDFNRADSATTMGTAPTSQVWAPQNGTWGIISNKAYLVTATAVDATTFLASNYLSDGQIEADITLSAARADVGLIFHAADNSNYLLCQLKKISGVDKISLYKKSAGSYTLLTEVASAGLVLGTTYKLRIEFYSGQLYVFLDNVQRLSHLMLAGDLNAFGSYVGYGLRISRSTDTTADDGGSRFDNFSAKLAATQTVTIERSLDGGDTWAPLRDMEKISLTNQVGVLYDYEVALYTLPQYRVQTFGTEVNEVASAMSDVSILNAQLEATSWWLKDPVDPSLNTPVKVMPPFNFSRKEPQQVYEPLGRKTSVVVTDGPRGISGTLNLMTKSKAEYDKINQLIDNGRPLMLVDVFGRSWYIKFGESHDWTMVTAVPAQGEVYPVRHLHTVSLPFVEVSPP